MIVPTASLFNTVVFGFLSAQDDVKLPSTVSSAVCAASAASCGPWPSSSESTAASEAVALIVNTLPFPPFDPAVPVAVSYTHLRAHETDS